MTFFKWVGFKIVRYRWVVVAGWIGTAILLAILTPPLSSLTSYELHEFLPKDMDSVKARALLKKHFPDDHAESSIVIVLEGTKERMAEVSAEYIQGLTDWLHGPLAPPHVSGVKSALTKPELADRFRSKDGESEFMVVSLDKGFVSPESNMVVKLIQRQLIPPDGINVVLTGDGVLGHDYNDAIETSIGRSTLITILLVVFLLLIIYRSPVTPLISFIPVGIAFVITLSVMSLIALSGVTLPDTLNLFLVVLLFGAGTDYCVFLIGRFREEYLKYKDPMKAAVLSTIHVGEAILSSAATITVGLSAMALGKFGAISTVGPCLALGIVITVFAALTLVPAILSIVGKRAFWPHKMDKPVHHSSILGIISKKIVLMPRRALALSLLLPLPLVFFVSQMNRSYDLFGELPTESWSVQGFKTLERHFPSGEIAPVTIIVESTIPINESAPFDDLYALTNLTVNTTGISRVFAPSQPLGDPEAMRALAVPEQLHVIVSGLDKAQDGVRRQIEGTKKIAAGVEKFSSAIDEKYNSTFPLLRGLAEDDYTKAKTGLNRLHDGVKRLEGGLVELQAGLHKISSILGGYEEASVGQSRFLDHLYLPPEVLAQNQDLQKVFKTFVSNDAYAARIIALQTEPLYSHEALDSIQKLRRRIASSLELYPSSISAVHLGGANPMMADIRNVTIDDQKIIIFASLVGIFLILILLFRGLWTPVYLLATMLYSFFITMGVTVIVFQGWFGLDGLDWKVPFLGFILLVALGIDYNILIMYRIREEQKKYSSKVSIQRALSRAGGVITACGIILAGTFSSLLFTPLHLMQQIGFAVSFGLLFVTFVVVTIVVPSITVLTEEWREKRAAKIMQREHLSSS